MLGICNSCVQLQSSDVREDLVSFFKEFVSFLQLVALYSYDPDSEHEVLCVGYLYHLCSQGYLSADEGLWGPLYFPCKSSKPLYVGFPWDSAHQKFSIAAGVFCHKEEPHWEASHSV